MNKAEKKFVWFATLAIFLSVTVLLGIINVVTFSMAASDADRVTEMLQEENGGIRERENQKPAGQPAPNDSFFIDGNQGIPFGQMGPMGPSSPEMNESLRYFTCVIEKSGKSSVTAFHISAVTEEEALNWAASLKEGKTGWTRSTYRYRVKKEGKKTIVTVVDQGRELISCYRILLISLIGVAVAVVLGYFILRLIGRKLFRPLEEADRKEKQFLKNVEQEFKVPLTVISANTELIDREHGPGDETAAIRKEVKRMNALLGALDDRTVFEEEKQTNDLGALIREEAAKAEEAFASDGKKLETDLTSGIRCTVDPEAFRGVIRELIENIRRYGPEGGKIRLSKEGERVLVVTENETDLPEGSVDRAFDRNTVLENGEGLGAGLSNVKEAVLAMNGRVKADVKDGKFIVTISL